MNQPQLRAPVNPAAQQAALRKVYPNLSLPEQRLLLQWERHRPKLVQELLESGSLVEEVKKASAADEDLRDRLDNMKLPPGGAEELFREQSQAFAEDASDTE